VKEILVAAGADQDASDREWRKSTSVWHWESGMTELWPYYLLLRMIRMGLTLMEHQRLWQPLVKGHDRVTEMFIAAGANVNAQWRKNKQPFERHRSADINMWWNGWLLVVGHDIDAVDERGKYSASSDNHLGIIFKWLNFFWRTWAHIKTLNVRRQSVIMGDFIFSSNEHVVKMLVAAGVELNQVVDGMKTREDRW
jgi:hypothetical protein